MPRFSEHTGAILDRSLSVWYFRCGLSLDQTDRMLIASLKLDGRMSYSELASRLGVSEGTARNRVARLVESGTVRILPIVDQTKVGYRLNVWIGLRCVP